MPCNRNTQLRQVTVIPAHNTASPQFINEVGEQLVEDLRTTRLDSVNLPALRDASPVHWRYGQHISFDNRDFLVEVAEHPGGQKSAHAGAQYHRMCRPRRRRPRHHSRSIARDIRAVSK
jgi:hypothetical protein